jgi:hypothetical protein
LIARQNSLVFIIALILSGILGLIGACMLPELQSISQSFEVDLSTPAIVLVKIRHLLWVPLILLVISWLPLRSNPARTHYYLIFVAGELILFCWYLLACFSLYAALYNFKLAAE